MATHKEEMPLTLGLRLRLARVRRRLSLAEVATATGISESSLSRYEEDKVRPPTRRLEELARLLELTPNQLLGWDRLTLELIGPPGRAIQ